MAIFYLDSSAIIKLIVEETETDALAALSETDGFWVTSDLSRTEVMRAVARRQPDSIDVARESLHSLAIIELSRALYDLAGRLQPPSLRSLDAIHVAAALSLGGDLTGFITYDRRLAQAASQNGLTVLSPGAEE